MVPILWDHLHVGKHNYAKPEDSDDSQTDVGNVYEHILSHNPSSSGFILAFAPTVGKRGKNPLVNVVLAF